MKAVAIPGFAVPAERRSVVSDDILLTCWGAILRLAEATVLTRRSTTGQTLRATWRLSWRVVVLAALVVENQVDEEGCLRGLEHRFCCPEPQRRAVPR